MRETSEIIIIAKEGSQVSKSSLFSSLIVVSFPMTIFGQQPLLTFPKYHDLQFVGDEQTEI